MTKTKQALAWISQGKPRSSMAEDLGLTQVECRYLLNNLMKAGYIQPVPLAYELTDKGLERAKHVPKSSSETLDHQRMLYRMDKPERTEKMLARAKRAPSNFIFNLAGAMQ